MIIETNVRAHPRLNFIKAFEVEISDGHTSHYMRVRKDWLEGRKIGDKVHYKTADGTSGYGRFESVRPIREA